MGSQSSSAVAWSDQNEMTESMEMAPTTLMRIRSRTHSRASPHRRSRRPIHIGIRMSANTMKNRKYSSTIHPSSVNVSGRSVICRVCHRSSVERWPTLTTATSGSAASRP